MIPEHEYDVAILVLAVLWGLPFIAMVLFDTYKLGQIRKREQSMRKHPSYKERNYR